MYSTDTFFFVRIFIITVLNTLNFGSILSVHFTFKYLRLMRAVKIVKVTALIQKYNIDLAFIGQITITLRIGSFLVIQGRVMQSTVLSPIPSMHPMTLSVVCPLSTLQTQRV